MIDKLKEYRVTHNLSEKEMAERLGITIKEYIGIEKGVDIDNKMRGRIEILLEMKSSQKAEIKIPRGITNLTSAFDRINSFLDPYEKMNKTINSSISPISALESLTNSYKPKPIGFDLLSNINKRDYLGFDTLTNSSMFSSQVMATIDSQLKAHESYKTLFDRPTNSGLKTAINSYQSILSTIKTQGDILKDIRNSSVVKTMAELVTENKTGYQNYLGFSSDLSKIVSGSTLLSASYFNIISSNNLTSYNKEPSILDVLSGSTFMLFDKEDDFTSEREIIEQINNDEQLKEEASSFFEELHQIINDDTTNSIETEKVENIFTRFVNWISKTFNKTDGDAKKISEKLFKVLPLIISLSFSYYISVQNQIAHEKTYKELQEIKEVLNKINNKAEYNTEQLLIINQAILDNLNRESSENMVALRDVNLRTRRSAKSKVRAIVLNSQKVIVLNKKTKWMEIIYVDKSDKQPKCGWVKIEYFK